MKLQAIKNLVTSKAARQILIVRKHSPVILFAAGVAGVVGTAILASRATLKLDDILDEHDETMDKIENFEHAEYTDENRRKDKVVLYVHTSLKIARIYTPAFLVGAASIASLTGSHVVLTKRNASMAAAYAVLDKGFRNYRDRVVKELGVDKERELRYDMEDAEITHENESGVPTKTTVKQKKGSISPYARVFDKNNKNWENNPHFNRMFISCQQNWANDLLRARGHLFLSEVYDMLGIQRSRESTVVGWILGNGDDFVDFGVFDDDVHAGLLFVNGDEPSVILDFNVDGIIWDKI